MPTGFAGRTCGHSSSPTTALILFRYDLALLRPSERFVAALASGEATEFEDQYMRIAPQFEVGAERYAWLCESLFLGRGRLTGRKSIEYELYRVL